MVRQAAGHKDLVAEVNVELVAAPVATAFRNLARSATGTNHCCINELNFYFALACCNSTAARM